MQSCYQMLLEFYLKLYSSWITFYLKTQVFKTTSYLVLKQSIYSLLPFIIVCLYNQNDEERRMNLSDNGAIKLCKTCAWASHMVSSAINVPALDLKLGVKHIVAYFCYYASIWWPLLFSTTFLCKNGNTN